MFKKNNENNNNNEDKQDTEEKIENNNKTKIKNLVFQGGSVKGIAYPSALKRAVENGHLDLTQVERVAGTSAGAITAMMLAVGYTSDEVDKLISDFDFTALLDEKGVNTRGKVLSSVNKIQSGNSKFFAKIPAKTKAPVLLYRLAQQFGIYDGNFFLQQAESWVKAKTNIDHLTFGELHELCEKQPQQYKKLYVVGVNLTTGMSQVFSHETTPDVIISDAVRISMSIPFLFVPHFVHSKQNGERIRDKSGHIWVDGGLMDNYPIYIFDRYHYVGDHNNDEHIKNPETLGFRLLEEKKIDHFTGLSPAPEDEMKNLFVFAKSVLGCGMSKQDSDHQRSEDDKKRSIYIDTLGISMLEFSISKEQQQALRVSGMRAVDIYFTCETEIEKPILGESKAKDLIENNANANDKKDKEDKEDKEDENDKDHQPLRLNTGGCVLM